MQSRTDLALEEHEYAISHHTTKKTETHIHGVEITDEHFSSDQITISTVNITTKNAAKALNKPMGTYITMEAPQLDAPDDGYHREISHHISECRLGLRTPPICMVVDSSFAIFSPLFTDTFYSGPPAVSASHFLLTNLLRLQRIRL